MKVDFKKSALAVIALVSSLAMGSASAASCVKGAQVSPYLDFFQKQLQTSTPLQANKQAVLAKEILTGQASDIQEDIKKGLISPNDTFDLGGTGKLSLLGLATIGCQEGIARVLLGAGADVNGTSSFRPLAIAAGNGNTAITELLLKNGAPIDTVDSLGQTPLEIAVRQRQYETVHQLIACDPQPGRKLSKGETLLDLVTPYQDPDDLPIANELRAHGVKNSVH